MNKRIFFSLLMAITLSLTVNAKKYPFQYDFKKLEKEATKGDVSSQYWMGRTYEEGRLNVPVNDAEAFRWYFQAAQNGDHLSQYKVAISYLDGKGVNKDDKQFIYWLIKSAEGPYYNGETFLAQINLAQFYGKGMYGLPKDIDKAIGYAQKASNPQGKTREEYHYLMGKRYKILGDLYKEKALSEISDMTLYKKAKESYKSGIENLSRMDMPKKYNEDVANLWMDVAVTNLLEMSEDHKEFWQAVESAYKYDHVGAQYMIGEGWIYGSFDHPVDVKKGMAILERIASKHPRAAYIVADQAYSQKEYEKAIKYYTIFTEMGNTNFGEPDKDAKSDALRKLSTMYRFGRGVSANEKKADQLVSQAALLGDPDAVKIRQWLSGL